MNSFIILVGRPFTVLAQTVATAGDALDLLNVVSTYFSQVFASARREFYLRLLTHNVSDEHSLRFRKAGLV